MTRGIVIIMQIDRVCVLITREMRCFLPIVERDVRIDIVRG